jgi:cyclophilin family peptidyl-prolyl cis-trans isomerase
MTTIADLKRTGERRFRSYPEMVVDPNKSYVAKMSTDRGDITIELAAKDAPKTVNNFVYLASVGYYDGLSFHRVITDPPFMVQGGCPQGTGTGGPGYDFADEINERKLVKGVLAMANAGPNTNGSQFFIVTSAATPWLDGAHTGFGPLRTPALKPAQSPAVSTVSPSSSTSTTSPSSTYTSSSSSACQWRWLDHAPGGSVVMFTPNCVRPAAMPSCTLLRVRHGSSNGAGYLEPLTRGARLMSIFGMPRLCNETATRASAHADRQPVLAWPCVHEQR